MSTVIFDTSYSNFQSTTAFKTARPKITDAAARQAAAGPRSNAKPPNQNMPVSIRAGVKHATTTGIIFMFMMCGSTLQSSRPLPCRHL